MKLVDFRVRITSGGTEAVTRVLIDSEDGQGRRWSTVGVSANIVDASFQALQDAIVWKLLRDGAPVAGRLTRPSGDERRAPWSRAATPSAGAAAMTAPPAARPGLMALYAFNLEIARAPWVASEPMLAEIRLRWWLDAIAEIYDGQPAAPPRGRRAAGRDRSARPTCRGGSSTR